MGGHGTQGARRGSNVAARASRGPRARALTDVYESAILTHTEDAMRTNIDLDDKLVERAMKLTGERTKRAVVHRALRLLVATQGQAAIRQLKGRIRWTGDLEMSRQGRVPRR